MIEYHDVTACTSKYFVSIYENKENKLYLISLIELHLFELHDE